LAITQRFLDGEFVQYPARNKPGKGFSFPELEKLIIKTGVEIK